MAKKTSKRVSERRKTKTAVKNSRKEAKLRRVQAKKHRNSIKVPKSYLMTDSEKEQMKSIKDATEKRTKDFVVQEKSPDSIAQVEKCILEKHCDAFVEVVDFRDIGESRSLACEELLKKNKKKVFVFVNYNNSRFDANMETVLGGGLELLKDVSALAGFKRICIFGNPRMGKFLLSKHIETANPSAEFEFVRTPVRRESLSDMLRGYLDLKDVNPLVMFGICWKSIDPEVVKEHYMVRSFNSYESFLDLLAEKLSRDAGRPVTHSDAALSVFKDMISGKIGWIKTSGGFYFDFSQQ